MRKFRFIFLLCVILVVATACNQKDKPKENEGTDDIAFLKVEFSAPESAKVGETVELKAIVTYGDEKVKDADEMKFEIWVTDDRENGEMIDGINNGDGTYTLEYTFKEVAQYEMYAHTTAREMHDMPKREIQIVE